MIDLEKLSYDAVELAFATVPTAVALGNYSVNILGQATGDYDPVSDTVAAPLRVVPNVRMMKVSASADELVGTNITVEDVKILIPAKDLPNVKPKTTDFLRHPDGEYSIIKIKPLPVKTLHILFCRAK
jgi:hypothetical protein